MHENTHTTESGIEYKVSMPVPKLSDFVESFWMVVNTSDKEHEIIVLPDGRFDVLFTYSETVPFHATLRGLDTVPEQSLIRPGTVMFAVSFKLLAIEYLLQYKMAFVLNEGMILPDGYWNITKDDLGDFDAFCNKVSAGLQSLILPGIDNRKQQLFELIYASDGAIPVKELSEKVFWSSRQINRYFNEQFGISLKAYCNLLRFRASLHHIKHGKLYPEENFTDQNHFIKEIKKFSGVVPKELFKNKNDRFILLSALPDK